MRDWARSSGAPLRPFCRFVRVPTPQALRGFCGSTNKCAFGDQPRRKRSEGQGPNKYGAPQSTIGLDETGLYLLSPALCLVLVPSAEKYALSNRQPTNASDRPV